MTGAVKLCSFFWGCLTVLVANAPARMHTFGIRHMPAWPCPCEPKCTTGRNPTRKLATAQDTTVAKTGGANWGVPGARTDSGRSSRLNSDSDRIVGLNIVKPIAEIGWINSNDIGERGATDKQE